MSFLSLINEFSSKNTEVFRTKEGTKGKNRTGVLKAQKSKVKVYATIMDALKNGSIGDVFSTDGSDRLYVITKQKWGKDQDQVVAGRVAKGFTPGSSTPSSDFKSIIKHSVRTKARYGQPLSKELKQKYASRIKATKGT